jgi:hypothetical protein
MSIPPPAGNPRRFARPSGGTPPQASAPDPSWPAPQPWQLWSGDPDGAAAPGGSSQERSAVPPSRPGTLSSHEPHSWRYISPAQPPAQLPPPVPASPRHREPDPAAPSLRARPSGGSKRTLIAAAIVAFMIAAGGGGFALARSFPGHGGTAGQPPSPAAQASLPADTDSGTPSSSQAAPAPSLTRPSTSSPSPATGTNANVAVDSTSPVQPQVVTLADGYFTAINEHDYSEYSSLLDPQMRQDNPSASFASGYATTTDSAETITGVSGNAGEDLAVTVTFTSHQDPADSPDNSSCTNWGITLYLVPQGSNYLIGTPPSGYTASYRAC